MITSDRVKLGGWAGVVAAILFVLTTMAAQIAPPGPVYESGNDYLHPVALLLAFVAAIIAIVGLDTRQRPHPRYGRLGTVGTVVAMIGYAVVALVVMAGIVMGARVFTEARIVGAIGVTVGSVLLGIATLRTRDLPWWCGVLLIIAFPLGDFANALFAGAEGLLLALLWGTVGVALLNRAGSPTIQSLSGDGVPEGKAS